MSSDLATAWRTNCRLNDLLLESLPDEALEARYSPRTRTVAAQFAHVHGNRIHHLRARAQDLLGDLRTFPRGAMPTRDEIADALVASREAMARFFARVEERGSVPSWKGPPASYLSYFVAHEAHHRALALVALRLAGCKPGKEITYGLWSGWNTVEQA